MKNESHVLLQTTPNSLRPAPRTWQSILDDPVTSAFTRLLCASLTLIFNVWFIWRLWFDLLDFLPFDWSSTSLGFSLHLLFPYWLFIELYGSANSGKPEALTTTLLYTK